MYRSFLKFIAGNHTARSIFRMFFGYESADLHKDVFDLDFRNPVGLAPGFDTDAQYYNAAGAAGCSFVVLGPLSFKKKGGVRSAVSALRKESAHNLLIGFDITNNEGSVSEDDIVKDYLDAFDYSYDFFDFTLLDFSSNKTKPVGDPGFIRAVTNPILKARTAYDFYHPVLLRLCGSLKTEELNTILDYCLMNGIDGVMLPAKALLETAAAFTRGRFPIIAESRIATASQAAALIASGASLVALQCTPERFKPALPKAILKKLRKK